MSTAMGYCKASLIGRIPPGPGLIFGQGIGLAAVKAADLIASGSVYHEFGYLSAAVFRKFKPEALGVITAVSNDLLCDIEVKAVYLKQDIAALFGVGLSDRRRAFITLAVYLVVQLGNINAASCSAVV